MTVRPLLLAGLLILSDAAGASDLREAGKPARIAGSALTVVPPRDWNRIDGRPGKFAETWTLDGEQLNDVTFYAGVEPGDPLVRERNRRRAPLPRFRATTLLVELPDLLASTYRAYRGIAHFAVTQARPERFLGSAAVRFTYDYTDADALPRKGEAIAAVVSKRLYMIAFDAPRLHYFDRTLPDVRALAATAALGNDRREEIGREDHQVHRPAQDRRAPGSQRQGDREQ